MKTLNQSLFFASSVGAVLNPRALSIGLQDFHNRRSSAKKVRRNSGGREVPDGQRLMEVDPAVRADVQDAISRFYTGRIGVRFLVEHHVSTMPPVSTGFALWLVSIYVQRVSTGCVYELGTLSH